jgi:hypothetical protein
MSTSSSPAVCYVYFLYFVMSSTGTGAWGNGGALGGENGGTSRGGNGGIEENVNINGCNTNVSSSTGAFPGYIAF